MSIIENVQINTHYTRSINLERDSDSIDVINAYIPTSRALKFFKRIADGFSNHQAPRAWSLVGPYGSGKSASSVFSSQLLSSPDAAATKAAYKTLRAVDPDLAEFFSNETNGSKGYLKVLITGSPESMGKRIIKSLLDAAEDFWVALKGPKPKALKLLREANKQENITTSEVIELVKSLQLVLEKNHCKGLLIVIDELGKFLEYEARHYGANDIYLLQTIAEHACKGGSCKLFLFVLLHQSFEQYAKGLGENLKNEWSKVQGRFEEVPFLESAEQVLRVVSAAFEHDFTEADGKKLKATTAGIVKTLAAQRALPGVLNEEAATQLLTNCYPLHPVSAILLPVLCQKVAQNERTLFSYLGSHEEYGLQDMLSRLGSLSEWIYPHHLYDYFITNQPAVLGDYGTHRRWAEVVTSIERLGDAPVGQVSLLKTIGILNIIGIKGGFKPSKALLETCVPSKRAATSAINALVEKSVVTYRQFSGEYRVWQGSDFDLEAAVDEELNNIGEFSLATMLNSEKALMPVVARRYTIKSGALRYFMPEFVDAQTYKNALSKVDTPRVIFFLAAAQDDEKIFHDSVADHFSELDVVALCLNGSQLREATAEVIALKQVQNTCPELNSDPVAKREFEDRLTAAEQAENTLLQRLLDMPEESLWFNRSKALKVSSKRGFQETLSHLLAKVYSKSPELHNELINRDKPSSQANAARNKLLFAMLHHEDETDLGIKKFPPEKAIYRSILRETGVHDLATLKFAAPSEDSTLYPVWQRIDAFLDSTDSEAKSFAELNQELIAPPYGVKAGVLPIIYIAIYIVYQHELALYEERRYKPFFTEEMLERFVKRPDEFTVQRFKVTGLRASIYDEYSKLIKGGSNVVQLVRPLAALIGGLEHYTHKTQSAEISDEAKCVRDAFNLAKSPEHLLFEDIPNALGFKQELKKEKPNVEGLAGALQACLQELKAAYPNMIKQQIKMLLQAFHMDEQGNLADLRRKAIGRHEGLDQHTVDVDGLKAFIKRLTKRDGDDEAWLENVLMFLGQKPTAKWTDTNRSEADVKLSDFAKRILDLEALRVHYDRNAERMEGDFDVILLKSLKKGFEPIDEVVAIDRTRHDAIQDVKEQLKDTLKKHNDSELQLAALAELVDEFLSERNKTTVPAEKKESQAKLRNITNG